MNESRKCAACDGEMPPAFFVGLCPSCLLAAGREVNLDGPEDATDGAVGGESLGHIGPYRLIESLGEGGMGIVYLAEQREPIRREVALKVIKAGMDTREVIRRFEGERQALAMMDHPGIARVLDAGETETGRPYFVMERVKGTPLTRYCDERTLGIRARLELFVEVCRAVQHAHQKGIIHRDLKPTNILVTEDEHGESGAKVIDFGIAKAVGEDAIDRTFATVHGQVLGTPQYMSPEQAGAELVDTRTDIYALGVILYELLTGGTPLTREILQRAAVDEILRMIREEEAVRPSLRLSTLDGGSAANLAERRGETAERWRRHIGGDLEWIVLKPLEKEASRRYETVAALAEDVGRYLRDEPVEARPPSRSYRVRKFARRNRGLVTTAATIVVILVVSTFVSVRWATEAIKARDLAETRLAQADAVPEFLIDAFRSPDPTEVSSELLAVDVLDQAVAEAAEEFSAQPVMLARILGALATTYQGLGYYDRAEETLDLVTEKIYGIGDLPADLRARLLVTSSETHRLGARMDAAIEVSRRNVELAIDTHGVESLAALEARREHLRNLIDAGHLGQADALMSQLLRDSEKLGGEEMKEYRALLGTLRAEQGRFDEALALLRERLRDHGGSIVDADWNLMWKIRHLAAALLAAGRSEEAVAWGEALLTCTESIYGSSHHLTVEAAVLLIESYRRTGEAEAAWLLASVALEKATKKGLGASRTRFLREHREAIDLAPEEKERLERFCHLPLETSTGTLDGDLPTVESAGFWRVVSEHRATLGEIEAAATAAELSVELTSDRSGLQYSMRLARYALLLIQAERREEAEKVLVSMSATGFDDEFGTRAIRDASVRLIRSYQEAGEAHLACELDRKVLQPALAAQKPLDPILIMQSYYRVVDHLVDTNKSEELQEFRACVGGVSPRI